MNKFGAFANPSRIGFLTIIAIAGCSPGTVAKKSEPVKAVQVKTVAVTQTEIQQRTQQPATVHAYYRAEIRAKATGFIKTLNADIGKYVESGAVLAEIDVPEMQMQVLVSEARIRRYEAEEKRAAAGIQLADANVASATAKLAEAKSMLGRTEASLGAAEAEFSRTQDMVTRGSLQNRMLDEVRMKRDSEIANRDAVMSSVDSAKADVVVSQAKKTSAEADLVATQAETEIARHQLGELKVMMAYASIKAPFSGIVTERHVEPGDLVRETNEVGTGKPLFVISQVDKVRVRIPLAAADAVLVSQGDAIELTFPSFADKSPINATVTRLAGILDPSTRTMIVEADLDNSERKLLPGMFGQASIHLATKVAAGMLPSRAIRFDESGNAYVYIVAKDETVLVSEITTGLDDGNSIEVLSGVDEGQRVIDAHLRRFTDGQKVSVLVD